jgi:hypothetical protein
LEEAAASQPAPPEGLLLRALVQRQSGDRKAAGQTLADAVAALDRAAETLPKDISGRSRWWQRQAEFRLLLREAEKE